jgi:hypothetical protein
MEQGLVAGIHLPDGGERLVEAAGRHGVRPAFDP